LHGFAFVDKKGISVNGVSIIVHYLRQNPGGARSDTHGVLKKKSYVFI
jgi:hypothetical protein